MPTNSATKVVTDKVRFSYVHIFEPHANKPNQEPRYSMTILIPKSDKATLAKIEKAFAAAAEAGKTKHFGGKIPSNLKRTLHDGDEDADLELNPEYKGHMYMAISSKQRPGVVDVNLNAIMDSTQVYSGCYGRVSMNAFAYSGEQKGLSFGLDNVMFLEDGEPLGGVKSKAEDDFAEFADGLI